MTTSPLTGYPKDFTIADPIYQVSRSSRHSPQNGALMSLCFRSWIVIKPNGTKHKGIRAYVGAIRATKGKKEKVDK
jgi:hypothetical protein